MSTTTAAELNTAQSHPATAPRPRLDSVDLIRGAVMILMALDHVRVYAGVPPGGPSQAVFFTRWITHFCAPAFVFLAGTGAFLHLRKLGSKADLSRFLITRGAWLILLEFTFNRVMWTFNFDFYAYNQLNVIWAIGCSMIVLAGLIHLPLAAIASFALLVIGGHNLLDPVARQLQQGQQGPAPLLQVLYFGGSFQVFGDGPTVVVLYSLIPWVGVMAAGYPFGAALTLPAEKRRRICFMIGGTAIAAFLVLRGFNLYGNPRPWGGPESRMPALLSFLATNKYPASLQFLLMTLGPCIALLPLLEHARGRAAAFVTTFGRVPLFYYLLHIPFIHIVCIAIAAVRSPSAMWWLFTNHPSAPPPPPAGYAYSLPLLWAVWIGVVVALYFPTHWYAQYKATHRKRWLSYL